MGMLDGFFGSEERGDEGETGDIPGGGASTERTAGGEVEKLQK